MTSEQAPSGHRLGNFYYALARLGKDIAKAADVQTLYGSFCRICVEVLGMQFVAVLPLHEGKLTLGGWGATEAMSLHRGSGLMDLGRAEDRQSLTGMALTQGQATVSNDFQNDPRCSAWHAMARETGLASIALVPIMRNGHSVGVVRFGANTVDYFDDQVMELLGTMTEALAFALRMLERAAQHAVALRVAEEKQQNFERLFEGAPVPMSIHSLADNRIMALNLASSGLYNLDRAKLIGHKFVDFGMGVPPEHRSTIDRLLAMRAPIEQIEMPLRIAGGVVRDVLLNAVYITYEDEPCYMVTSTDITENRRIQRELAQANAELSRLSTTDALTGLQNRRHFDLTLHAEWSRSSRQGRPLALMMVDIDHFKLFNDRYGHLGGDECLRQIATLLRSCIHRAGETLARFGGEEFAILLPDTDAQQATELAQECVRRVEEAHLPHEASPSGAWVTLSIGVATRTGQKDLPATDLVEAADRALYEAKRSGRNQVVSATV